MIHHIVGAYASAQFQTVHARHHQVGYNQVGYEVDGLLPSVLSISSVSHSVAFAKHFTDVRRNVAIVLYHEHRVLVVLCIGIC